MHPLQVALESLGMTQRMLATKVTALKWKRSNGKPLRLKQNSISQICAYKRRCLPDLAKAIEHILGEGNITASLLVMCMAPPPAKKRGAA